jgi:hypothetical protein
MTLDHADFQGVIEEVGRLLGVFEAQLSDSLHQASHEFGLVGAAFQEIAAANERLAAVTLREPELTSVRMNCERIGRSLSHAVMGLQCHDRLAQRLGHIRDGLDHLQNLLGDGNERSHAQWLQLLRGVDLAQQTEQSRLAAAESAAAANIELF